MKKLVRFICFVLIASTVMFGLNFYFSTNSDKDGIHIRGYFKEPQNTVDVLLIGEARFIRASILRLLGKNTASQAMA